MKIESLRYNKTFKSNKTFGPREMDYEHTACIDYLGLDWSMFAEGYRKAANLLANTVQGDRGSVDDLVYPIAFNFRHAIELQLKLCCFLAFWLYGPKQSHPTGHDLDVLWQGLKPHVVTRFIDSPDYPCIPEIEEILGDFIEFDKASFNARYPTDLKGHPSLPDFSLINIAQLQERANRLLVLLQAIEGALDLQN